VFHLWATNIGAVESQGADGMAARDAAAAVTADEAPSTANGANGADRANGAAKPAKLIERAKSQKDVTEGRVRYFCSSCMEAFGAKDASRGKIPEACPQGHPALDAA
jgi:hypothetical protein